MKPFAECMSEPGIPADQRASVLFAPRLVPPENRIIDVAEDEYCARSVEG
jgi:hypothetical protein